MSNQYLLVAIAHIAILATQTNGQTTNPTWAEIKESHTRFNRSISSENCLLQVRRIRFPNNNTEMVERDRFNWQNDCRSWQMQYGPNQNELYCINKQYCFKIEQTSDPSSDWKLKQLEQLLRGVKHMGELGFESHTAKPYSDDPVLWPRVYTLENDWRPITYFLDSEKVRILDTSHSINGNELVLDFEYQPLTSAYIPFSEHSGITISATLALTNDEWKLPISFQQSAKIAEKIISGKSKLRKSLPSHVPGVASLEEWSIRYDAFSKSDGTEILARDFTEIPETSFHLPEFGIPEPAFGSRTIPWPMIVTASSILVLLIALYLKKPE